MAPYVARAQGPEPVRFSLEFRIYGGNAPMFLARRAGFPRPDLDVSMDGSVGSGESVTRVATGTHKFGLADPRTLVEFTARNPKDAPKLIMTVFDRFPAVVLSLKRKPIKKLQELVGESSAPARPTPARKSSRPCSRSTRSILVDQSPTIDVKLRDTMLIKGEVDAVVGFDYTTSST